MTACPDKEHLLHASLDGELDAASEMALGEHLEHCPACAAELERLALLRDAFADPAIRYPVPEGLRARIEAMAGEQVPAAAAQLPSPRRRLAPWLGGGAMGAIAAGLAALILSPLLGPNLQDELVADHVRSTLASHLTDVATSDRHTVKPWFNGRIDFAPPVVDLADQGFPLAGGRLDYVDRKVVAALVYRRRLHVINLFVWPEGRTGLRASPFGRDGYSLEHWRAGGLEFWAVSDVEHADLKAFRQAFQARTPR